MQSKLGRSTTCEICGFARAVKQRVTRTYGRGARLMIIEDVPVVHCPHCGETYLTAATLHELERIKLHHPALSRRRPIPVAAFPD